jgi:hypothetical protein
MWSKSNPLVVFALDLMSAYEGEHKIFGLLGQTNFTQNDVLQFGQIVLTTWSHFLINKMRIIIHIINLKIK